MSSIALDLKVKEVLKLSHDLGHRDGTWDALSAVHRMLKSMGYNDLSVRLCDLSRELAAPINEFSEPYDDEDSAYADMGDDEDVFAHVTFHGVDYIDTDDGWMVMEHGYKNPTVFDSEQAAQAAADAFLAEKKGERGE